jgi:hypothetical protein
VTEVVVGPLADFPPGTHKVVEAAGREIGVFNIAGRLYGLPNRCPHQTGPLCEGRMVTGTLVSDRDSGWNPRWVMQDEVIACPLARPGVPRPDRALPGLSGDHLAALPRHGAR